LIFSCINPNSVLGARNRAIISLFLDTGLRLSELANLKESDVHLDQRYVKVMGKGGKERIVPLGTTCQQAMLYYYHHFRSDPINRAIDRFFLDFNGYPLSPRGLASLMVRLSRTSGVKRLHPHLLRHTYATRFLLNGGDVFLLKQNLGHSTLAMVEHYRHIASREAAILSESFSPLDRMNLKELRTRQRAQNIKGPIYPNAGSRRRRNHDGDSNRGIESEDSFKLHRVQFHPSSPKGHNRQRE
jgi:site-specific recombinase XerD